MQVSSKPVIIIGGGMAGLTCAYYLYQRQVPFLLLEKDKTVGGRLRTEQLDGFLLDRGFQVFLSAYPEAKKVLDYDGLELRDFRHGALIRDRQKFFKFPNPLREPMTLVTALLSPVGTLSDKLRVLRLGLDLRRKHNLDLLQEPGIETYAYLKKYGWSERMIQVFFKPFFGGVFLERDLRTSSNFFRFLFKQFLLSDVCLPSRGIQAIPTQLEAKLPPAAVRKGVKVQKLQGLTVILEGGEQLAAAAVVVAADGVAGSRLLGLPTRPAHFQTTTCTYFSAPKSPLRTRMLLLNPLDSSLIHNLCVPTDIAPTYGSDGRSLISVSTHGSHLLSGNALVQGIKRELQGWFGNEVQEWEHLKTYQIPWALPQYLPSQTGGLPLQLGQHLYRCGDYTAYPSLNGAMQTGREVAERLIASLEKGK